MDQSSQEEVPNDDENIPRDAKVVRSLLKSMGVTQFEPRVVNQFLDLWYRYVTDVLSDAQVYAEHAGKPTIDSEDIKLAVQSRVNFSFSQPPPRETLVEIAKIRNSIPLPKVVGGPVIALPPDQDTLITPNYQLIVPTRTMLNTEDMMDYDQAEDKDTEPESPKTIDSINKKVSFSLTRR